MNLPDFRCPVLAAAVLCIVVAAAPGQVLYSFDGDSTQDRLGYSVAGAGDVNADGFADLIAGAPYDDNNGSDSGSARVYSGVDGSVLYTFVGDSTDDWLGFSVSGAGDVNADGFADVIAGAPGNFFAHGLTGYARVYSGLDGSVLHTFTGDDEGDLLGFSVSGAGDVNGDGFDDVIAGAPYDDNNGAQSGTARVLSGFDGAILHTFAGGFGDYLGHSVSGAGDVNGDGFDDVIAGAPYDDANGIRAGYARVYSGVDGAVLHVFSGGGNFSQLGWSVSDAGDVNGDGFDDVIFGAPQENTGGGTGSGPGTARVFSGLGGQVLHMFSGDDRGDFFGYSVSGSGDVNGDGFDDVIVGATNDGPSGVVRVFSGLDGALLYLLDGASSGPNFGWSVAGAGDVSGDGFHDFVLGTPLAAFNGSGSGRVTVHASTSTGQPGRERILGQPCIGGADRMPRIGVDGRSVLASTFDVTLHGGPPGTATAFLALGPPVAVPVQAVIAPGCTLYVNPVATAPATASGGFADVPLSLPSDPQLLGGVLWFQWFVLDPDAPRILKASFSQRLELTIGQ